MKNNQEAIEYSKKAEALVNKFNILVLTGIFVAGIFALVLNIVGVFKVDQLVMSIGTIVASIFIIIPVLIYVIHDLFMKNKDTIFSILYKEWFKWVIISSVFISVGAMMITLTNHVLILIIVPPLLTAQYKTSIKLVLTVFICSLLLVPIGVYGGYFFGSLDKNLVKLPDGVVDSFQARMDASKDGRMMALLTHYVLPRCIAVSIIDSIIFGISSRFVKLNKESMILQAEINSQMEKTNRIQETVIDSLAAVIENRDTSTGEHVFRTKKYVELICEELINNPIYNRPLDRETAALYVKAAPLHDIGKIKISDVILLKPAKLDAEEFAKMKTHSEEGREIIRNILTIIEDEGFLRVAQNIAAYHHEKWDGSGYPEGKKEDNIPLCARIMAIADVFDALVSKRVYKEAYPLDESFKIIKESSGTHFDPELVKAFLNIRDKIEAYYYKK